MAKRCLCEEPAVEPLSLPFLERMERERPTFLEWPLSVVE